MVGGWCLGSNGGGGMGWMGGGAVERDLQWSLGEVYRGGRLMVEHGVIGVFWDGSLCGRC